MVPGRPEGSVLHTPTRWENDKVSNGHTRFGAGARQDGED